jgi:hypothetical protein
MAHRICLGFAVSFVWTLAVPRTADVQDWIFELSGRFRRNVTNLPSHSRCPLSEIGGLMADTGCRQKLGLSNFHALSRLELRSGKAGVMELFSIDKLGLTCKIFAAQRSVRSLS